MTTTICIPVRRTLALFAVVLLAAVLGAGTVLAAGPIFWDWPADRSFEEVQLEGAAVDTEGNLKAGLAGVTAGPAGPEVFWKIVPDGKGGYFTGTGHGGEIHHTTSGGESSLVARLEGTEVFSLHVLDDGDLLAGCGPEGQLYRVDRDGEQVLLGSVPGGYVWAMAPGADGKTVWLATGSPAAVHRLDLPSGELEAVRDLPAQNALDLAPDGRGGLLVATQGPGLVYRLDPDRPDQAKVLFETAQDEVRQFITGPDGRIFVLALNTEGSGQQNGGLAPGSSQSAAPPTLLSLMFESSGPEIPRAALYEIAADDLVVPWWTGEVDLMLTAWSPRWGWLGGGPLAEDSGQTVLYGLTPPAGHHPVAGWAGGDILDLLVTGRGTDREAVVVCQAHPGSVTVLSDRGDEPRVAISPALDGGLPVRWGRLNWRAEGDAGKLEWSVRGGNRYEPDDSWTAWSKNLRGQDAEIPLEPCRFLQWRVEFPPGSGQDPARVTSVAVSAWQDNHPPLITSFTQEHLKEVHLGMMNNHNENITQTFRSGLKAEFSTGSAVEKLAGPERTAVARSIRIFTWEGVDPNGDRIVYELAYRSTGEDTWRPILADRAEPLGSWDTAEVPDGSYHLRLTASDSPDNPAALAATSSRTIGPIMVDNSEPEISGFAVKLQEDGVLINLTAKDEGSVLAGARLRLPDGSFERLDPVDGICDTATEKFSARVAWPREGVPAGAAPWQFRVEVRDMGGNTAVSEGEAR
jgi:hypothetical protein